MSQTAQLPVLSTSSIDKLRQAAVTLYDQNKALKAEKRELSVQASTALAETAKPQTFGSALWDMAMFGGGVTLVGTGRGLTAGKSKMAEPVLAAIIATGSYFMDSPDGLQFAGGVIAPWWAETCERATVAGLAKLKDATSQIKAKLEEEKEKQKDAANG